MHTGCFFYWPDLKMSARPLGNSEFLTFRTFLKGFTCNLTISHCFRADQSKKPPCMIQLHQRIISLPNTFHLSPILSLLIPHNPRHSFSYVDTFQESNYEYRTITFTGCFLDLPLHKSLSTSR